MKKLISIVCCIALIASMFGVSALAAESGYTDTDGHWAESSIDRWSEYGVFSGVGNNGFDPNGSMTRAQAAQVFANLLKLNGKGDLTPFKDVDSDAWYAPALSACVDAGIMNGVGEGAMDPNGAITREMFFVMFARALGIAEEPAMSEGFDDEQNIANWAAGYVSALVNAGYVGGVGDGTLAPKLEINRASVASLLDKTIAGYAGTDGQELEVNNSGLVVVVGNNVTITGTGKVTVVVTSNDAKVSLAGFEGEVEIVVKADNVALTDVPSGTKITVTEDTTGATSDGSALNPGTTTTTTTTPDTPSGGDIGGGGGYMPPVHSHTYGAWTSNNNGTHSKRCTCGDVETEACVPDSTTGLCSTCGVYLANNANAAAIIKAAPANSTIVLTAGNYAKIDLDVKNNAASLADNLTIIAQNGTTVAGMDIHGEEIILIANGLTLRNFTFTDNVHVYNGRTNGVTVTDCDFTEGACLIINQPNGYEPTGHSNVTVANNTFSGTDTDDTLGWVDADQWNYATESRILVLNATTATIQGNDIASAEYNGIQLAGKVSSTILISGNTIDDTGSRGIRLDKVQADTAVTISNNILTDTADAANEVFKVTSTGAGASITFSGNTYDGIAWDPADIGANASGVVYGGIVEWTGGATADEFEARINGYPDSTTIILKNGEYDLSFYNPATNFPVDLTIIGGEGATVTDFESHTTYTTTFEGCTLSNLTFTGNGVFLSNAGTKDFTIDGCTFNNGARIYVGVTTTLDNDSVTIQNCTINATTDDYNAITVRNAVGTTTIQDNTVNKSGSIGIALLGHVVGTVLVDGNTIDGVSYRALRVDAVQDNATVTISDNTISNCAVAAAAGEGLFKVTSTGAGASITFSGNTYDGIAWDPADIGASSGAVVYTIGA